MTSEKFWNFHIVKNVHFTYFFPFQLTVFRSTGERDKKNELDEVIMTALFKAQHLSPTEQLSLALAWNRCDIATKGTFFQKSNSLYWFLPHLNFPAKITMPKYEKIACFEVPQIQNDGILTISNVQNLRFSHIWQAEMSILARNSKSFWQENSNVVEVCLKKLTFKKLFHL